MPKTKTKKALNLAAAIFIAGLFAFCQPANAAETTSFKDGDLIRANNSVRIYEIVCGKRHRIGDLAELAAKHFGKQINVITPAVFAQYPAYGQDDEKTCPLSKEKLIKVDLKTQTLAYFEGDKKIDEFKISSGVKAMPSPTGIFSVLDKVPSKDYGGRGYNFYYPNTKWNLHFTTQKYRYYIHGAYWHNKFGQPMSHGCINVSYADMEPLYSWADGGTKVIIN